VIAQRHLVIGRALHDWLSFCDALDMYSELQDLEAAAAGLRVDSPKVGVGGRRVEGRRVRRL
jgi:hypothetical protein